MDPRERDLVERAIRQELGPRIERFREELAGLTAQSAGSGIRGGAWLGRAATLGKEELGARRTLAIEALRRVVTALPTVMTEEQVAGFARVGSEALRDATGDIAPQLDDFAQRQGMRGQIGRPKVAFDSHEVMESMRLELDLIRVSREKPPQALGQVVVHGPVGVIQTGAGAYAQVSVSTVEIRNLTTPLQEIERHFENVQPAPANVEDLREIVRDALTETARERPNRAKLSGLLTALAAAIQTTAALQPAYQAIKSFLASFGVTFP